jgi:hypothetical protein
MVSGLTSLFADALIIALPVMGTLFLMMGVPRRTEKAHG